MENNSGDEHSDDGLRIVVDNPRPKKRNKKELDETDKKIIESVEKDLEENLEEKAAKANLTAKNVKNIIKEVVTNEHVLALVRHVENPDSSDEPVTVYEPKYTRAKTKQLLSTNTQPNILPWVPPTRPVSEVQKLFTEDLQEDSSGDEYVPSKNTSFDSALDTSQVALNDDEEANIARRTRSKLCLSHTPLEVIEEAFMPPDITTDMYDMDCDDDVWKEFLKTFTRPLDEVTKGAEDEDHDPEYNVLADEEIDEVDKEELRADRAVTVSRKEFNCLMAELFEFADIYESNRLNEKNAEHNNLDLNEKCQNTNGAMDTDLENDPNICIKKCQIPILAQQMRQHVQMLTHNFLLSHEHPEWSDLAFKFKQMLTDVADESRRKSASICHAFNLQPALQLVANWEKLFASKNTAVIECKRYVEKVIGESKNAKQAGTEYIVTFPPLVMKTISNSEVFIYPNLLPRIPFKSFSTTTSKYYRFTPGEENLIALFLEQSIPHLKQDPFHLTQNKQVNMQHVGTLINNLLMPNVGVTKIVRHIKKRRHPESEENPIKFFHRNKRAPPMVHYIIPLDDKNIVPPCKRSPECLPFLWREYIYPNKKNERVEFNSKRPINNRVIIVPHPLQYRSITNSNSTTSFSLNLSKNIYAKRRLLPKGPLLPIYGCVRNGKRTIRRRTRVLKNKEANKEVLPITVEFQRFLQAKMLPDMPSLGNTPVKNNNLQTNTNSENDNLPANTNSENDNLPANTNSESDNLQTNTNSEKENEATTSSSEEQNLPFKDINNFHFKFDKPEAVNNVRRNFEAISEFSTNANKESENSSAKETNSSEKDNLDDINEFMKASSTVKNVTKKEPSGAEKKRAKIRREFVANLVMATPDDLDTQNQKEENFADAFFDKLRLTLSVDDYNKLIDILAHYDETNGDFVDLYQKVQSILFPTYKELSEEFLLFLTDIQAQKVGKLMPYFLMKDMDRFMKKLQVYFKDQPSQMKKIIKALTDLSDNPNVTIETIKATVLPLFKGNAALTDWFLQIFPYERPPLLITTGPHDLVDMAKELVRPPDEEICETVLLPDMEDPYGGPNCICTCHNVENSQFQSRLQHCKKCGLKFIQGKIYIQSVKTLQPAVVSFLTNPEKDHLKRLMVAQRKRSDSSPSKHTTSPHKENHTHEEHRNCNESDDDGSKKKGQKQPKTQRKRKTKNPDKLNVKEVGKTGNKEISPKTCDKSKSDNTKPSKISPKRQNKKRTSTKKTSEYKPGSTSGQQKRPAVEQEIEYPEPAETVKLKVSSDHSGESESEFFESSQDMTNTDSDDSTSFINLTQTETSKEPTWTREEDKIILQTFRQSSNDEETFKKISEILKNRSAVEIKGRFHKLMSLLQQMASNSSS